MGDVPIQRISGTYWERLLLIALPIPAVCLAALILKDPSSFPNFHWDGFLIICFIVLLVWIIDCEPARRSDPVPLIDGEVLQIGNDVIRSSDIQTITALRRYRQPTTAVIEIIYLTNDETKTAYVLSKPDLVVLGLFATNPKTLRLLLKTHPELRNRVQPERRI